MIEQALYDHLKQQTDLTELLTTYNDQPAIFNQEAPSDVDKLWASGVQYSRIVFAEDLQGDPERIMSGTLVVDIMCADGHQFPETIEPIVRSLIDGYFFSNGTFTAAAQWKNSSYFTQPTDEVLGCTVSFELLAFPVLTTSMKPDVIARLNKWSSAIDDLYVINHDELPSTAWKPKGNESAVYWRVVTEKPAGWIPDTYSTIWRTATVRGHIFSEDLSKSTSVGQRIIVGLYACKRLMEDGEAPVMVNRSNTPTPGADALRTGQLTVEATYGIIVYKDISETFDHISY